MKNGWGKSMVNPLSTQIMWIDCPTCGRKIPMDTALAERRFNHIVFENGGGRLRIMCPEGSK